MEYQNSLKALRARMLAKTTGMEMPERPSLEAFVPSRNQQPQETTEDLMGRASGWLSEIKDAAGQFARMYNASQGEEVSPEAKGSAGGFMKGFVEKSRAVQEAKEEERIGEAREAFIQRRSDSSPSTYTPERPKEREVRVNGEPIPLDAEVPAVLEAIAAVESRGSGDYAAIGPVVKKGMYKGQRAYGRYQVMEGNIAPWTKAAVGRSYTVDEFMASPEVQDAVAAYQLQQAKDKYGTWEDAASVWFSGRPVSQAGNASDGFTTVPDYIAKFRRNFVRS